MNLRTLDNTTLAWLKCGCFILALLPLTRLVIAGFNDNLGANPIEKITRSTGYWTLTLLFITLSLTPLRRLTGALWLVRLRRMSGLFAFFYASLHFLTYLVLDQFFDGDSIVKDIVKRPYITVGFVALVLLIPLAVTSTNRMIKLLGGKRWQLLHRLIYLIAALGVLHFWWLVKKDTTEPRIFALLLIALLGIRACFWLRGILKSRAIRAYSFK